LLFAHELPPFPNLGYGYKRVKRKRPNLQRLAGISAQVAAWLRGNMLEGISPIFFLGRSS
jgi:hypothetical protein